MITVIAGENQFGCKQRLDSLLAPYQKEQYAVNEVDLEDMENPEELADMVTKSSLFAKTDVILVKGVPDSTASKDILLRTMKLLPSSSMMFIYLAGLSRTNKLVKSLQDSADQVLVEDYLPVEELLRWAIARVESLGGTIDRATARHLLDFVGEDQFTLSNEIDKLVLHNPKIDSQTIENITMPLPRTTIFNMLDAMINTRSRQAVAYCRALLDQKVDPSYIMSMICWQAYVMSITVAEPKGNWKALSATLGVSPYALAKSAAATKKLNKRQMVAFNEQILQADHQMKSYSLDKERFIEQLVRKISLTGVDPTS